MQQLQNCMFDKDLILQSDGTLYIGQFIHQHLDGYSIIINPDGSYYYGLFKESIPKDIGVYKLKNSCLKLHWDDYGQIAKVEDIPNVGFLSKVISFKNNEYGNKILIKLNPLCYGVTKNGKFEGFTIMHYKNGDIYYGNIYKGKQDGEGIIYNNYHQEWYWNKYQNGKLISHKLYGKNLVPRELIIKIFNKIQFKTQQITMVSLSHIQQLIINQLLLNSEQNHLSLTTTIQSTNPIHRENISQILNDELEINNNNIIQDLEILQQSNNISFEEDLQIYNQKQQQDEIDNNLTKCQTEKALTRIEKSRTNKFRTQTSQSKSPKNSTFSLTPKKTQTFIPKLIVKRQISPAFSTIRHLFSVIRI